jgi:hypothetical protein
MDFCGLTPFDASKGTGYLVTCVLPEKGYDTVSKVPVTLGSHNLMHGNEGGARRSKRSKVPVTLGSHNLMHGNELRRVESLRRVGGQRGVYGSRSRYPSEREDEGSGLGICIVLDSQAALRWAAGMVPRDQSRAGTQGDRPRRRRPQALAGASGGDGDASVVAAAACREHGVSLETLRARGRHGNQARSAAVCLCRRFTRAKIGQIGACLGGVDGSTVSHIARAVTAERRKVRGLDARLAQLEAQLRQNADPKS